MATARAVERTAKQKREDRITALRLEIQSLQGRLREIQESLKLAWFMPMTETRALVDEAERGTKETNKIIRRRLRSIRYLEIQQEEDEGDDLASTAVQDPR